MQAPAYTNLESAELAYFCDIAPMTNDELIDLIRTTARTLRVSQAEMARVAEMPSQSAMFNVMKGKRKLSAAEAEALKKYLGLHDTPLVQMVPLIGIASAGNWNEAVLMPIREFPIPFGKAGKRAFAVEVNGDSMDKILPQGGWAVVDPDQTQLYVNRVYLLENDEHETTIKRYCGEPARFEPVSTNDNHKPISLGDVHYRVIGRVVAYGNDDGL